jgi:hypothetical protein
MKDVSTAESSIEQLPDGRTELRISHELVRGVTPAMLVWWFRTFPLSRLEHEGKLIPMYRIWHPRDHIRLAVLRKAPDRSPGVSRGAIIAISERIGPKASRVVARVAQMDEAGLHLVIRRFRFGPKIAELRHTFTETPQGTLYRSRLLIGSTRPLIGRLVNVISRRRIREQGEAWLKHNVEEVGNFQFFLPRLYANRLPETEDRSGRPARSVSATASQRQRT